MGIYYEFPKPPSDVRLVEDVVAAAVAGGREGDVESKGSAAVTAAATTAAATTSAHLTS